MTEVVEFTRDNLLLTWTSIERPLRDEGPTMRPPT